MTTTVILPVLSDTGDIVESITSVLNNNVHPSNLCIITHESTGGKKIAAIDAFFKSCCGESSSEEVTAKYKMNKTIFSDVSLYKITIKEKFGQHPVCYLPDSIYDNTDIFLTMTEGIKYKPNFVEKYVEALEDMAFGAVYSDYILNDNYTFLSSMHIMMREKIEAIDIGFKRLFVDKNDAPFFNKDLMYKIYARSIIGHIPEALFTT
jgi:hypothetical protein